MPLSVAVVVLLVAAAASEAADDTRYNASMCQASLSFACGPNVNIHYPFFLANATMAIDGYTAPSYCGYPGMAIACDDGRATLLLEGRNYTVVEINYDNHTATVADADVLGGGDCPRVTHNVTVPAETWLNLSATANENLVFFFDCVFTAKVPRPPGVAPINCNDFPAGRDGLPSYVVAEPAVPLWDELPRACGAVLAVPVLRYWLLNGDYFPRLNDDGYGEVLKRGFQLTWDPSAGPCYVCEVSGGQCSYNQKGEFLGCLCSDGRVRDPDCG